MNLALAYKFQLRKLYTIIFQTENLTSTPHIYILHREVRLVKIIIWNKITIAPKL